MNTDERRWQGASIGVASLPCLVEPFHYLCLLIGVHLCVSVVPASASSRIFIGESQVRLICTLKMQTDAVFELLGRQQTLW